MADANTDRVCGSNVLTLAVFGSTSRARDRLKRVLHRFLDTNFENSRSTNVSPLTLIMYLLNPAATLLSLTTLALLPSGTQANPDSQSIEPSTGYQSCPAGATYQRIEEYFSSYNQTSWQLVKGPEGATFGREGAKLAVSGTTVGVSSSALTIEPDAML